MFCKDLLKDWSSSHLVHYGWYMDYPKDNTPSYKILFQKRNEPRFQKAIVSSAQLERGKKKGTSLGKRMGKE
jgi:hypothetical protein